MVNIATILQHNVIGKLLNHVVVFAINVMIVRMLEAQNSGVYFNELYLINFVVFIFSAGLDYAAISVLSSNDELLPAINKMLLKVVLIFSAILFLYVFFVLPYGNDYFHQPAIAILLFGIGNLLLIFYQGVLSALKKFNMQNIVLVVSNLLFLFFLFFLERKDDMLPTVAIGYAILLFIQGFIMTLLSWAKQPAVLTASPVNWGKFTRHGAYIMLSSLVYFAFLRIDNFFVQSYDDPVTLGNYVQCGKVGQYFLYFSSIISSTLLPFMSTESIGSSYAEWKKMMKPYVALLCLAAIIIAATGRFIFPFFFGGEFNLMHNYMIILLPGFVCLGILTLMNAVYIGKGNIKRIFIGDVTGLVLVTLLDILLVPRYGAYAAAIISSACYCIVFLILLGGLKAQFNKPARKFAGL